MKHRASKLVALILALSMFAGCMTACGGKNGTDSSGKGVSSQKSESEPSVEPTVNEYGWEVPAETMNITFYHTDRGDPDKDARLSQQMHDYILENFNVDLTRIVYDADSKERLNLMLASNEYPEAIVGMDEEMLSNWKSQERLADLTPYVDQYGANIKEMFGDRYNRYLDEDGKLYGIPRGFGLFPIPDYSAGIRYDWWTEMGSPKIETPDDYFNVLSEMVAKHPTNPAGEKVYAMSWNQTDQKNFMDSLDAYFGIWGLKKGFKEAGDHSLTHWLNTEEGLEAVKYLNKYTAAGLMDPDAFINTYEDWKQKFSNERILGNINSWQQIWNAGHEVWQKTWDNWNDDQRFVQIALKAPEAEASYMTAKDTWGWNYAVVTDKCEDPSNMVKWINFSMTSLGQKLLCWGLPNDESQSIWHYDGDEKWHWDETRKSELFDGTLNYDKYDLLGGWRYSIIECLDPMAGDGGCVWYDQNFNEEIKWKKMINDNMEGTIYDATALNRAVFSPDNPLSVTKQQIDDTITSGFAKCVMAASQEECEKAFNDLRDSVNAAGLHDIEEYRTEEYQKTLTAWDVK